MLFKSSLLIFRAQWNVKKVMRHCASDTFFFNLPEIYVEVMFISQKKFAFFLPLSQLSLQKS